MSPKVRGVRIANEILMYFRAQRKTQGEVSLDDTLEAAGEGGSLSFLDVLASDEDMAADLDQRDACAAVRACVERCLQPREKEIIIMRYGLDGKEARTQKEVAAHCGISRSYVSRIEKKALEKLQDAMQDWKV